MPLIATAPTARHLLGTAYIGSSAGTGYELSGTGIATALTTAAAIITLILFILNGNRKTRREVAKDIEAAYEKGQNDQYRELKPWLELYKNAAQGAALPPMPAPPNRPRNEDEEDDDA